jgi:hypothetical protein
MASVYKRTWYGQDGRERVRWVAAYKDQDGRRHNKGFLTKKDAKAFLVLTEGEIVRGVHTPESSSVTVAAAAQLWLKRGELGKLERSSLRQYRNDVDLHIAPLIGAVKLARLSTPVVQAFRDKLIETRSRALARKVLASLKSIIGEAMRRGLVARNTALPVTVDVKKREQGKLTVGVDVPSKEEVSRLLERVQGRWRPFFVTAGMRASELRRLTWAAVDFEQRDPRPPARRSLGHDRQSEIGRRGPHDPDGAAGRQYAAGIEARLSEGQARAGLSHREQLAAFPPCRQTSYRPVSKTGKGEPWHRTSRLPSATGRGS